MNKTIDIPFIMSIFGGTGDLAHRKLFPAIYNLAYEGLLSERFALVGTGRKPKTDEQYRNEILASIGKHSRFKIDNDVWNGLSEKIYYYRMDLSDLAAYAGLRTFLDEIEKKRDTGGNRLHYLSVAPEYFETVALSLKFNGMASSGDRDSWQRLVIEKPFGKDLATARRLNESITEVFREGNVFRIDHYLGKEMLQNMLVIRFGNPIFESVWNSRYIDNIQITSSETCGVGSRAGYYESSGAMRDMIQNHMLQLVALVAMEPPISIDAASIRDEKVKLLRSLGKSSQMGILTDIVRGQYGSGTVGDAEVPGYRSENGVSTVSDTETFVATRLSIGNFRWGNMPFYLRTGKRMAEKFTNIVIEFRSTPEILYFKEYEGMRPNILEIRVQPDEGISFRFNAKKPGPANEIANVKMDFCQSCKYEGNSPEAYERLISDVVKGDHTLFTSWDEIEASWSFTDGIIGMWNAGGRPVFPNYPAGTWGPSEADRILAVNGHKWWNPRRTGD